MKRIISLMAITTLWAITIAQDKPTICTKEYMPVCGFVQVQCITAPCPPVQETFGNRCMAQAAGATDIREGTCEASTDPGPIDVDPCDIFQHTFGIGSWDSWRFGDEISLLQHKLKELGYFKWRPNGFYSPNLARAVASFQRANKLKLNGRFNQETQNKLESIVCETK